MSSIKVQLSDEFNFDGSGFSLSNYQDGFTQEDDKEVSFFIVNLDVSKSIEGLIKRFGFTTEENRFVLSSSEVTITFPQNHRAEVKFRLVNNGQLPEKFLSDGIAPYKDALSKALKERIENSLARQLEATERDVKEAYEIIKPPMFQRHVTPS